MNRGANEVLVRLGKGKRKAALGEGRFQTGKRYEEHDQLSLDIEHYGGCCELIIGSEEKELQKVRKNYPISIVLPNTSAEDLCFTVLRNIINDRFGRSVLKTYLFRLVKFLQETLKTAEKENSKLSR